ncbi:hypothetical protein [Aquimarina brevivitae]|uniref:Uncharacterized protein n=1 Tax=Aquimarina brevivitae TaxID=323412 RepID=A0A4Q7P0H3_9FLAO|nr:hypothetical protein [Aquimarina brevivitae]RZS93175.1 hypothetical protein EV197_1745 [Aquimarina brevivitae]
MKIKVENQFKTLEEIVAHLKNKTEYEISIRPDEWLTDDSWMLTPGKKCVVVKKSATAGAKIEFVNDNTIEVNPIAPSSFINRVVQNGIIAFIVYGIIIGSQKQVAKEVEAYFVAE